jgi:hypothetical protein
VRLAFVLGTSPPEIRSAVEQRALIEHLLLHGGAGAIWRPGAA